MGPPIGPPHLAEVDQSLQDEGQPGRCFLPKSPLPPGPKSNLPGNVSPVLGTGPPEEAEHLPKGNQFSRGAKARTAALAKIGGGPSPATEILQCISPM
jgi:hypothetical protein